ncbi:MAG: flotillin-like FloA family protein [Phycisphaerales bacterium JB039]
MTTQQILLLAIAGALALVAGAWLAPSIPLWLLARRLGCPVAFGAIVGMRLRKAPVGAIVRAAGAARAGGVATSLDALEIHALAGGDPEAVVTALVEARRRGMEAEFDDAAGLDLAGCDVIAVVRAGEPIKGLLGSERSAALGDRFRKR